MIEPIRHRLPLPAVLTRAGNPEWGDKLNRLLQELAWDAVVSHPLSGVQAKPQVGTGRKRPG